MDIFVTGGSGFIGAHVIERLLSDGHLLTCLVRKTSNTRRLVAPGVTLVQGDLTDRASIEQAMRGCERVVHLAAHFSWHEKDPGVYRLINVEGQRNLMETALKLGISKVIDVSTIGVWGNTPSRPVSEFTPFGAQRHSPYFESKYQAGLLTWDLYERGGLPLVSIYPVGVIGAGEHTTFRPILEKLIAGYPGYIYPKAHMPVVSVQDVVEVIVRTLFAEGLVGEKFIVGKDNLSMHELFDMLCEAAGLHHLRRELPNSFVSLSTALGSNLALEHETLRFLQDDLTVDGRKAVKQLGLLYSPLMPAIRDLARECLHRQVVPA